MIGKLTIFYDEECELCRRCRAWLERQPAFLPLGFVPCGSPKTRRGLPALPGLGKQLVVIADTGAVWIGPAAFVVCLWALRRWRAWSFRLTGPWAWRLAARFLAAFSDRRRWISALLTHPEPCAGAACAMMPTHRSHPYR
jgi:predicted DCC family thiol-disulfide oxidoreductase YuxK